MAQTEKVLSIGDVDILGDDVNRVQLGVGAFNIFPGEEEEEKDVSAEGRVELRLGQNSLASVQGSASSPTPTAGYMATAASTPMPSTGTGY